jgi:hypothetical protein
MQKIQLYIEGQRVDMFDDESVSITQSIKNVKDIDKVFTDFTRTFSLPASKTNNKIFKHYYNFDIQNGFDARIRKPANIELNTLPFTEGLIKLEGVDLKDNKPHTYKITFFGNTVTLNDILGDDKLSGLNSLTNLNQTYDATSVKDSLQDDPTTNDIITPLITHTQILSFDSHSSANDPGNIAWDNGHVHGVLYTDLKYAIRLHSIIEAIETKYPTLSFSDDFFVNTNAPYYNLFMWLHRKKGDVENLSGLNESLINTFTNDSDVLTSSVMLNNALSLYSYTPPSSVLEYTQLNLKSTTSNTNPYKISIRKNGIEVANSGEITSGLEFTTSVPASEIEQDAQYTVYIESDFNITFSNITFQVYKYDNTNIPAPPIIYSKGYAITNFVYTSSFEFDITQQIPDIKVIDFLSGLFKMFNLTAFVERNETEVTVKTLDSFYSAGVSYDITKYIDVSKSQVNVALPYRKINFSHEDTKTFLAAKHTQLFGETWGEAGYDSGQKLDGSIYNVKTPFAQLKYERLIDENPSGVGTTDVQWGWFVDDNQESYIGKPLLFYPIRITSGNQIAFLNSPTDQDPITTYNIPSNSVALSSATSSYNMNFNAEQNEWGALEVPADVGFTNSLFEAYHKNYITSVFNLTNRITKVTAYLPLRILLNYTLADRFVIAGKSYKINSIKTNLKNGKSDLELLNDL